MADFVEETLQTIQTIRQGQTPGPYIRQRIQISADNLSNKARVEGALAVVNEALNKLAAALYETVDFIPVNVDSRTYKILIPVPWGDSGYHIWKLRSTEARLVRWILMARCKRNPDQALFLFSNHYWYVNARIYSSAALAADYLKTYPITMREWDKHNHAFKESEAARYERRKEKRKNKK